LIACRLSLGGRHGCRDAENHDGDPKDLSHRAFSCAYLPAATQDNARTAKKENEV
jgi:hypothetical protein